MTVGIAGLGVIVGAASVAWGCASVTSPYLNALQPNSAQVPATVVVSGGNWVGGTNLNLVWAPTGQVIGSVTSSGDGGFSARVEIPAAAERGEDYVAYVRAVQGLKYANTPFGVDSPAQEGSPTVPKHDPVTSMSTSGGTGEKQSGQKQQVDETNNDSVVTDQSQPAGSGGIPTRPADSTADAATTAQRSTNGSTAPAAAGTASRARQGSTAARGASASPLAPAPAASSDSTPAAAATPSQVARGSLGDLWTGVEGAAAAPGRSLLDLQTDANTAPSGVVGVGGVLALSLVALAAGFGVAEVRRRRVMAEVEG